MRAPVRERDLVRRGRRRPWAGCSSFGPASRTSLPMSAPITSSERPMLKRQSPTNAYASCVVGLAARLVHREEVGEHLRRMPLGGEPVVDGHAGVLGERLDVDLTAAAVLDARRTSGRARARCRRSTPCGRSANPTDRDTSRARPGRTRRPRTPSACGSTSSRRSARSPCRRAACASVPAYFAILSASESSSRKRSSRGSKSISFTKLRFRRLNAIVCSSFRTRGRVRVGRSCSASRRGRGRARSLRW